MGRGRLDGARLVVITCGSVEEARSIARHLVEVRLAAPSRKGVLLLEDGLQLPSLR